MKKDAAATAATDQTPPADKPPVTSATAPAGDEVAVVTDEGTTEGEQLLDPNHKWPSQGGCYVRQPDGTLKRED